MQKLVLLAALLSLSLTVFADATSDVRCREIAFSEAAENKDADAFRLFLDGDARFVGNVVSRGPYEIVAAWEPLLAVDGPSIRWRPQFVEVREDGDLALTRGPYRMIVKDADGKAVEQWGTFNSIWRRNAEGVWHVIFDAGSRSATTPDIETRALLDSEDPCE